MVDLKSINGFQLSYVDAIPQWPEGIGRATQRMSRC